MYLTENACGTKNINVVNLNKWNMSTKPLGLSKCTTKMIVKMERLSPSNKINVINQKR